MQITGWLHLAAKTKSVEKETETRMKPETKIENDMEPIGEFFDDEADTDVESQVDHEKYIEDLESYSETRPKSTHKNRTAIKKYSIRNLLILLSVSVSLTILVAAYVCKDCRYRASQQFWHQVLQDPYHSWHNSPERDLLNAYMTKLKWQQALASGGTMVFSQILIMLAALAKILYSNRKFAIESGIGGQWTVAVLVWLCVLSLTGASTAMLVTDLLSARNELAELILEKGRL